MSLGKFIVENNCEEVASTLMHPRETVNLGTANGVCKVPRDCRRVRTCSAQQAKLQLVVLREGEIPPQVPSLLLRLAGRLTETPPFLATPGQPPSVAVTDPAEWVGESPQDDSLVEPEHCFFTNAWLAESYPCHLAYT